MNLSELNQRMEKWEDGMCQAFDTFRSLYPSIPYSPTTSNTRTSATRHSSFSGR